MVEEKEKPLTRKDVKAKIKEHGGPEGLDLSRQVFEEAIDLSDLDLHGIIFRNARFPTQFEGKQEVGAKFDGSNLNGADLRSIGLEYAQFKTLNDQHTYLEGADLRGSLLRNANFQGADLRGARFGEVAEAEPYPAAMLDDTDFRGSYLPRANFKGCYFDGTKLEGAFIRGADILEAHLDEADWGRYVIGEESKKEELHFAESIYRQLKQWYTTAGHYDIAGEFLFREMEAKRKNLSWFQPKEGRWLGWWPLRGQKVRLNVYKWLYGYGERPWRVVLSGMLVLFGFALVYFFLHGVAPYTLTVQAFGGSLYYSAVSFTALGYGPWFSTSSVRSWVQGLGAFEAFIGVFTIALFLVTFTRKMIR